MLQYKLLVGIIEIDENNIEFIWINSSYNYKGNINSIIKPTTYDKSILKIGDLVNIYKILGDDCELVHEVIKIDYKQIDNFYLWSRFDNIQFKNPFMKITYPVTKENNRISIMRTGSGWYLYYKNDDGSITKALKPNGDSWLVPSRIEGVKLMYKINKWNYPKEGFK